MPPSLCVFTGCASAPSKQEAKQPHACEDKAKKALRNKNIEVTGMVAIFTYGFDISVENFKNENLKLETLSNYKTLVECALKNNYIKSEDLKQLITWNSNPSEW